jgi:hypothetical protein
MGIKESLGEYFLGSETRREFTRACRAMEKFTGDSRNVDYVRRIINDERKRTEWTIRIGKYFPFLFEFISVYAATVGVSEDRAPFVFGGAGLFLLAEAVRRTSSRELRTSRQKIEGILENYDEMGLSNSSDVRSELN